jgi:four helix bundle protein
MFDFERLEVYQVVRDLNNTVFRLLYRNQDIDADIRTQWKKASMNIMTNLAEGTGRMSASEKKNYITNARGCVNTSVALLHIATDLGQVTDEDFRTLYDKHEQASKMLLGMYRSFASQSQ